MARPADSPAWYGSRDDGPVKGSLSPADEKRRNEISTGLTAVRARIAAACQAACRSPAEITLIAVTKTRPASDIRLLADLGVTDVGENRAQEAAAKAAECAALGAGRTVTCLVQVSLDDDPGRGGAAADQVLPVADAIAGQDGLVLGGIMAVAPLGVPPASAFAMLSELSAIVRSAHPAAVMISAGMSGDLEQAIEAGATHVRVGTALLGSRQAFVR